MIIELSASRWNLKFLYDDYTFEQQFALKSLKFQGNNEFDYFPFDNHSDTARKYDIYYLYSLNTNFLKYCMTFFF